MCGASLDIDSLLCHSTRAYSSHGCCRRSGWVVPPEPTDSTRPSVHMPVAHRATPVGARAVCFRRCPCDGLSLPIVGFVAADECASSARLTTLLVPVVSRHSMSAGCTFRTQFVDVCLSELCIVFCYMTLFQSAFALQFKWGWADLHEPACVRNMLLGW